VYPRGDIKISGGVPQGPSGGGCISSSPSIRLFQLVDHDHRGVAEERKVTYRHLDLEPSIAPIAELLHDLASARDVGVSGDAKAEEIWRPAGEPYPMPPMKTLRNGQVWLKDFEAVGIRMVPAAVGMNSTEYKGRPACIYDGWCHVGCPIGVLANPLVTYLADARKSGAEVRPWSTVTRVLTNPEGTRVTGVEYYDQKKERQLQPTSVVVLAAWASDWPNADDDHRRSR
jgi:choline dehydrogenase-like flavoprotein